MMIGRNNLRILSFIKLKYSHLMKNGDKISNNVKFKKREDIKLNFNKFKIE